MIWKTSERRMKQNTKHNGMALQQTRTAEDRLSKLKDKKEIKGKTEEPLVKNSRPIK
jgi:hypothetical protein